MKYLLLIAVILVVYLMWRHQRVQGEAPPRSDAPKPGEPQEMVRCAYCAVHLPRADAVADGQGRLFCSAEHRKAAAAG